MHMTSMTVLAYLAVVFAAGIGAGLLIYRMHSRRARAGDSSGSDGMSGSVGFIGGAAAFLLSVLMLASLDHYNATKGIVVDEALALSAAFDSTDGLAPADQATMQRDLACLMRSVATNSWTAAENADLSGSDNTHAWRLRASVDADRVEPKTKAQENSLSILQSELINANKSGQQRLLAADADLPVSLWILVFLSIFVLTAILTALLRPHPSRTLAVTALGAVVVVSNAMVLALNAFDQPFDRGDGVYISPRAINAVMVRMEDTYPGGAWAPCEELADP